MIADWVDGLRRTWERLCERPHGIEITVRKTIPVGQKAVATLVEVNGELLLLGVTNSAVSLIRQWEKPGLQVRGCVR